MNATFLLGMATGLLAAFFAGYVIGNKRGKSSVSSVLEQGALEEISKAETRPIKKGR